MSTQSVRRISREGSHDDESLDPRIQVELERLNKASDDINCLEVDLDEARSSFRSILSESTQALNSLSKKLGKSIENARPYYEARFKAREAQAETQRVALKFERACSMHEAAKEMVQLAELGHMKKGEEFDPAWQEMLNHATMKVNEAEKERNESEIEHMKSAMVYNDIDQRVQKLQKDLKRSVSKSRPYFETKAKFNQILEEKKKTISAHEHEVSTTKSIYSSALHNLEQISDEIHRQRMERRKQRELGIRGAGVGTESPLPPPSRSKNMTENYHKVQSMENPHSYISTEYYSDENSRTRSESDMNLVVNPNFSYESPVFSTPDNSRRRSYRLAIEKSTIRSANVNDNPFNESHKPVKQQSSPECFPEAPSLDDTYKSLPYSRQLSEPITHHAGTKRPGSSNLLSQKIYNPHHLSIDEYFKRRRRPSKELESSVRYPIHHFHRELSAPVTTSRTEFADKKKRSFSVGNAFSDTVNVLERNTQSFDEYPKVFPRVSPPINMTDIVETKEVSHANDLVKDSNDDQERINRESRLTDHNSERHNDNLIDRRFETTDPASEQLDTDNQSLLGSSDSSSHHNLEVKDHKLKRMDLGSHAVDPSDTSSKTEDKSDKLKCDYSLKNSTISDLTTCENEATFPNRRADSIEVKSSPSTPKRKLQGVILTVNPGTDLEYNINRTKPMSIPTYYGRSSARARQNTVYMDEAVSRSLPNEKSILQDRESIRRIEDKIKGTKSVIHASLSNDDRQLSKLGGYTKIDYNVQLTKSGSSKLSPNVNIHKTAARKKSRDHTLKSDIDDDCSDSDSVVSGGGVMDDEAIDMLTLTFDETLTVDDDFGQDDWKGHSLPENLRYLEQYIPQVNYDF